MRTVRLAPSILTADFGRLADEARAAEAGGADLLHLDVMDGRFVPVISFGPAVVEALRRAVSLPFDVHLMVSEPERGLDAYTEAAATVNVHVEATAHVHRALDLIRRGGARAGVCLNPGTPLAAIEEALPDADQVTVMTVNPGWGGQRLIPSQLEKAARLREMIDTRGYGARIQIDGGVTVGNAARCAAAGADALVCGGSVYNDRASVAENLAALRAALDG